MNFIEINNTKKIKICTYILQNLRSHLGFCNLPSALYIHNDISLLQSLLGGSISAPCIQKMTCRMQRSCKMQSAACLVQNVNAWKLQNTVWAGKWKDELRNSPWTAKYGISYKLQEELQTAAAAEFRVSRRIQGELQNEECKMYSLLSFRRQDRLAIAVQRSAVTRSTKSFYKSYFAEISVSGVVTMVT